MDTSRSSAEVFRFGAFEASVHSGELRRDGMRPLSLHSHLRASLDARRDARAARARSADGHRGGARFQLLYSFAGSERFFAFFPAAGLEKRWRSLSSLDWNSFSSRAWTLPSTNKTFRFPW